MGQTFTGSEVVDWLKRGGDAALITAMELIGKQGNIKANGDWAASFIQDVPVKARQFRGKLTEKQQAMAIKLMTQPAFLGQLVALLPAYLDVGNAELTAPPEKVQAAKPEVDINYANDKLWGIF
jgi:hypothetical protein